MTGLQAQAIRKPVRVLTTKDGLPQSFVSGLAQDSTGFVWIGTRNGLARYDGRQFITFHYRQEDTTSLSSDVITSLLRDKTGHLWIEHESGAIDRLTPHSQRIDRINQRPLAGQKPVRFARRGWTIDQRGNLWGTQLTGGVWCYNWTDQTSHHYTPQSHGLPNDTVRGVLASGRNNRVWLLSRRALSGLNPATGKVQSTVLPASITIDVDHLPGRAGGTIQLHERNNGQLMWVYHNQLVVFDPVGARFRLEPLSKAPADGLCWFYTGPDGQDYLTVGNRVFLYDDRQPPVLVGELGQAAPAVEALLVDRSGLIWMGTDGAGVQLIDPAGAYFETHPNRSGFHPDLFQQVFGVSLATTFDWPPTDGNFRVLSYLLRTTYDRQHRLWVGVRYRAGYLDSARHQLNLLPPIPTAKVTLDRPLGISGMGFDPAGVLWTVDNDGYVAYFDARRNAWQSWLSADGLRRGVAPQIVAQDLVADRQAIWITDHQAGLIRIERATKKIRVINQTTPGAHLPSNLLLGMQPDPTRTQLLWIGSHEGLVCLDKTTLRGQLFTTDNGLPDNTIYSMLTDRRGFLWLSTNKGLCRFDPRSHQVRTFNTTDGLPGDEFNRFHHLRLPDGRFAFGGTDGWVLFNPLAIQDDHFQPVAALTELKINNQTVPVTPGRGVLPVPVNDLTQLVVPFADNTLSLSFAGLQYNQPARLRYRYQLVGYDERWVDAGLIPLAAYTQLPPGHYTLRINTTNTTGQWSTHEHTLAITVTPPWWRTIWAYGCYALLGFILLRVYVRLRTQQEREYQLRLAGERKAAQLREVDELKNRFFANITHEFRTPLTLILSPVETLVADLHQTRYEERLSLVERNARQLLGLINQLMDLARLDARQMNVATVQGRPDAVVAHLLERFTEAAASAHIDLMYQPDGTGLYWFDPDKLERIVTNLVANALRFTPGTPDQPGRVTVGLHLDAGLQLTVSDTGIGIAPDYLAHLFDRFYQVETPAGAPPTGTGIGLALVRELVELQRGSITVESQPGRGTTFRVSLPYQPVTTAAVDSAAESTAAVTDPVAADPVAAATVVTEEGSPAGSTTEGAAPEKQSADSPEAEAAVLLLVEDNDDMARFISQSLPGSYTVHRAADGLDGLEQARQLMPDLIISDVMMPRMNGYELCEQLKTDPGTDHIPVVLLTAKTSLDSRMQGLRLGADEYLDKPFHVAELQLRVRNLLATQRRLGEKVRADLQSPVASPEPVHPFVQTLYQILDRHLDDATFGAEELAMQANMSRMQLYRKLKVLAGLPATDFIRAYRLRQSVALLQQGLPVSQTAYAVGFESPSYFGQCFREQFGEPPSRFATKSSQ